MRVVLLGATRGMGRSLARRMAERGDALFLLGRQAEQLSRSARDLEDRGAPQPVGCAPCDLLRPDGFVVALETAVRSLGGVDTVVVTAGMFAGQGELETDAALRDRVLAADFANTIAFCEAARPALLADGRGTLCVFSSVAGDRARKPVILYGAAKAGLSHYLAGLDLKFRPLGLRVVCVKPGFVKTGMTAHLDPPPFAGDPDRVADVVLRAIDDGRRVVYAPPVWRWIMLAIRALPSAVLRRLDF